MQCIGLGNSRNDTPPVCTNRTCNGRCRSMPNMLSAVKCIQALFSWRNRPLVCTIWHRIALGPETRNPSAQSSPLHCVDSSPADAVTNSYFFNDFIMTGPARKLRFRISTLTDLRKVHTSARVRSVTMGLLLLHFGKSSLPRARSHLEFQVLAQACRAS